MQRIQKLWLRLMRQADVPGTLAVEKIEDGYFAVVLARDPLAAPEPPGDLADYRALESSVPNLSRTRAVYLNSAYTNELSTAEALRDWAPEFAASIESGARHAFAVIDPEVFEARVARDLEAAGWQVEPMASNLRVSDGRLTQQVNLLRGIVQMVLSRSGMAEAATTLRKDLSEKFAIGRDLYVRFAERFEGYSPAILDHYFVAYPESSCLAAGWDYWEVDGKKRAEAKRIFERAMEEFESVLKTPSDEWLPGFSACACEADTPDN